MPRRASVSESIMEHESSCAALNARIAPLVHAGETRRAVALCQEWLDGRTAHDAGLHLVHFNLGVLLMGLEEWRGAQDAFSAAIRSQPDFYPARINLGNALERQGLLPEAVACWRQLVERLSLVNPETIDYKNAALKQIGRVLKWEGSEVALRQSLELDPHQHDAMEFWISWRQDQWKWPVIQPFARCDKAHLMKGFAPLSLAAYTDDPLLQLANARMYNRLVAGQPSITFLDDHARLRQAPSTRPRVGYLSS
ncbi:MAG: hypothetical protein HQM02_13400, partial [Magnetococcales bacterium]|nr:hypothetical protein [Magnetococcales bacterium]